MSGYPSTVLGGMYLKELGCQMVLPQNLCAKHSPFLVGGAMRPVGKLALGLTTFADPEHNEFIDVSVQRNTRQSWGIAEYGVVPTFLSGGRSPTDAVGPQHIPSCCSRDAFATGGRTPEAASSPRINTFDWPRCRRLQSA